MLHLAVHRDRSQNGIFDSSFTFNGNNNRIDGASGVYPERSRRDASGNMLNDGTGGHTFTGACPERSRRNAENRMSSSTYQGVTSTYTYDGDGKRVMKSASGSGTIYWYGAGSDTLMETDLSNNEILDYFYFAGRRVARHAPNNHVDFYIADALGNTRRLTTLSGDNQYDYYPFGGERDYLNNNPTTYKFTGKERDSESGLDNFGARYLTSNMGRFLSADPDNDSGFDNQDDPQSWNAYSYVRNNPVNLTDPDGKVFCRAANESEKNQGISQVCDVTDTQYVNANDAQRAAYNAAGYQHYDCSCDTDADRAAYQQYRSGATTDVTGDYFFTIPGLLSGVKAIFNLGRAAGASALELTTIGSGTELGQIANVVEKAGSAVGRQGQITVSSEKVAQEAADQFLGPGSKELKQTYGNRAGQVIGRVSADGSKQVRFDTNAVQPHYNFENRLTGSNLHVFF